MNKFCRILGHRFDRRDLFGYTIDEEIRPSVIRRTPYVRCNRCQEEVQTWLYLPTKRRFPA